MLFILMIISINHESGISELWLSQTMNFGE